MALPSQLSVNFSLDEFQRVSNRPITEADLPALQQLVNQVLQPARRVWGPIRITSYIRTGDNAIGRGGSHVDGGAVDFVPVNASINDVFSWIAINLPTAFGRVINERDHIHITRPGPENWAGSGVVLYEPVEGQYEFASVAPFVVASAVPLTPVTIAIALIIAVALYLITKHRMG